MFHGNMKLHFHRHIPILITPETVTITLLNLTIMERQLYHLYGLFKTLNLFIKFHGCLSFAEEFGDFVLSKIVEMDWIAAVIHTTSNSTLQRLWTHHQHISNHHIYYNIWPVHPYTDLTPTQSWACLIIQSLQLHTEHTGVVRRRLLRDVINV